MSDNLNGEHGTEAAAADELGALAPLLLQGEDFDDEFGDDVEDPEGSEAALAPPVHWPSLDADDARDQMVKLWSWTQRFQRRFPETLRLPECWPHHNGLVELLQALADHERASFSPLAPPTAAVSWHLVVRDVEARLRTFVSELPCRNGVSAGARSHEAPAPVAEWQADANLREWLEQRDHG